MGEELRPLHVDMDAILDGFRRTHDDPFVPHLDLDTGAVRFDSSGDDLMGHDEDDDQLDDDTRLIRAHPRRFAEVPRIEGHEDHRVMERVAQGVAEADVRALLLVALQGKGAFGRFRDVLGGYPDLQAQWRRAQHEAHLKEARHWLHMLGLAPTFQLRLPPPEVAPRVSAQPPAVRPSLMHVLLLGFRSGEPERGGKVTRVLAMGKGRGREGFRRLARELCEWKGLGWRSRFVEGKSSFAVDDITVMHTDDDVVVTVEVPAVVLRQFGR
jgi:hypothetical protein